MWIFLKDMFSYPFCADKEQNQFWKFLTTIFKDYPAFFWAKPTFKKALAFPFVVLYALFRTKKN